MYSPLKTHWYLQPKTGLGYLQVMNLDYLHLIFCSGLFKHDKDWFSHLCWPEVVFILSNIIPITSALNCGLQWDYNPYYMVAAWVPQSQFYDGLAFFTHLQPCCVSKRQKHLSPYFLFNFKCYVSGSFEIYTLLSSRFLLSLHYMLSSDLDNHQFGSDGKQSFYSILIAILLLLNNWALMQKK